MAIPKKFEKRLKQSFARHAVWEPGSIIKPGDVVQKNKKFGVFSIPVANIRDDFGIRFRTVKSEDKDITITTTGTSTKIFQGGAEVSLAKIDLDAEAEVEFSFESADSFVLKTPIVDSIAVQGMFKIGQKIKNVQGWRHGAFRIVQKVYVAETYTFLGSEKKSKKIRFKGKGNFLVQLITVGASANVSLVKQVSGVVDIKGKNGAVAMALARVRKNGDVVPA